MSRDIQYHTIGDTGVSIPAICFGTSSLGDMPKTYHYGVDEQRARETLGAIFAGPAPFIDTSRNYGMGRSEERIGDAIRAHGGLPKGLLVSTKLDRDMDTLKFDGAAARRSIEQSLTTMNLSSVDILHLHDPEYASDLNDVTGKGGSLEALLKMKEEGLCRAIGLAAGRIDIMMPILQEWDFDVMITHNRHTLLNANAEPMIELARSRGVHVMNAAPYAGGAFAKGAQQVSQYSYVDATEEMLSPVRAVEAICARYDVPTGAAALQFSMRDARISSTICGVSKPERVMQTLSWANYPIPEDMWAELAALPRTPADPEAARVYHPG